MRHAMIAALFVAALLPSPIFARDVVLTAQSKWVADFGENSCRLVRSFGDEGEQTVLIMEQIAPSTTFNWTVAGPSLTRFRWSRDIQVHWGPEFDSYERSFLKAELGKLGPALIGKGWEQVERPTSKMSKKELRELGHPELAPALTAVLAGLDAERAARVDYLSFRQGNRMSVTLMLEDMGAAVSTLNQCTRDLAKDWGFDESYRDQLTTVPVWLNIREVGSTIQRNYPSRAEARGAQANFRMRIIVGSDGKAERCDWINDTVADDFEMRRTPCDIVMNDAEFEPALDEQDNPIRSIYETSILYRMN